MRIGTKAALLHTNKSGSVGAAYGSVSRVLQPCGEKLKKRDSGLQAPLIPPPLAGEVPPNGGGGGRI